jgi:arylsulfatase A-like enzyme
MHFETLIRTSAVGGKLLRALGLGTREVERPQAVFGRKDADEINQELVRWLDRRDTTRPFFAFLNYFDAHDPYLWEREPEHPFGLRPASSAERQFLREWHVIAQRGVTPRQCQLARDCYDDCLAELDRGLGRLTTLLEERGLLDSTWIVVTSDHGEQFGEHGFYEHGNSLHTQVTRVPLLIVPPRGADPGQARVIETPVSLCDLAATVLDVVDCSEDSPFPGGSLRQLWDDSQVSRDAKPLSPAISEMVDRVESTPGWQPGGALSSDGLTYIRTIQGTEALYDLVADPQETTNLAADSKYGEELRRLRARLDEVVPRVLPGATPLDDNGD